MSVGRFTSYDVDQDKRFSDLLKKISEAGLDSTFVMGEAARIIKKFARKNFILKGYGQYPPLNARYAARKLRKFGPLPILVGGGKNSGRLRDSVISGGERQGHPDSITVIDKNSLILGTRVPYASYNQEGTKHIPARLFLYLDEPTINLILATAEANLEKKLEDA